MRKIFMLIAILSVVTIVATAQSYTPAQPDNQVFQSQQVMQGGAYRGTVYEPFSNTTPSEQSAVGASYSPGQGPARSARRGDFDDSTEGGEGDEGSPIGDGLIPLSLLALAFAGFIFLRRRKTCE